jgi:5-methylcytosine-specific restriction endonuclease McrA
VKRTPIKRISDKRRKANAELDALRPEILARGCEYARNGGGLVPCRGALVAHHVLPRSHGGKHTRENLMCLCDGHHKHVHAHPEWARRAGYLR